VVDGVGEFSFRRLTRADFPLLAGWLAEPHVARWWNHDVDPEALERDFGASADGAEIYPWAVAQFMSWSQSDPVSWKERMRNGAVYVIQHNRNPFVDHPEFVSMIYDSSNVVGTGDAPRTWTVRLRANAPNPFHARTSVVFELARHEAVSLIVFDVSGRVVRRLIDGEVLAPGPHAVEWDGRAEDGSTAPSGLYFTRIVSAGQAAAGRLVRL